jgi:hypothetical protein
MLRRLRYVALVTHSAFLVASPVERRRDRRGARTGPSGTRTFSAMNRPRDGRWGRVTSGRGGFDGDQYWLVEGRKLEPIKGPLG